MNKLQKKFKRQIKSTEKKLFKSAIVGTGVFSNPLFLLSYFGKKHVLNYTRFKFRKFFKLIFKGIFNIIKILILICLILIFMYLVVLKA